MSTPFRSYFSAIFLAIVVLDIGIGTLGYPEYRVFSKPLILISLLLYFLGTGRHLEKMSYRLTGAALVLSLLGDIFLLFDAFSPVYFMVGLASFLLAHLLYGVVFSKKWNKKPSPVLYGVLLVLIVYGTLLFLHLKPHLNSLTYPVLGYVCAILFMAITALWRFQRTHRKSFVWVFGGALCFILSDSILALHLFVGDLPYSTVWIMGTYALAQYLIVSGMLWQDGVLPR